MTLTENALARVPRIGVYKRLTRVCVVAYAENSRGREYIAGEPQIIEYSLELETFGQAALAALSCGNETLGRTVMEAFCFEPGDEAAPNEIRRYLIEPLGATSWTDLVATTSYCSVAKAEEDVEISLTKKVGAGGYEMTGAVYLASGSDLEQVGHEVSAALYQCT